MAALLAADAAGGELDMLAGDVPSRCWKRLYPDISVCEKT